MWRSIPIILVRFFPDDELYGKILARACCAWRMIGGRGERAVGWSVKGSVFVDYVRMIRSRKDVDWRRHLKVEDFQFLAEIIEPEVWYPMETFERFGLGILAEIALGDLNSVYIWGRFAMDDLFRLHQALIAEENPQESLMRFQVLRASFFDFEEASSYQTAGFLERLIELSGAKKPRYQFQQKAWQGSPETLIQLDWD
jgi:hypothetical protein